VFEFIIDEFRNDDILLWLLFVKISEEIKGRIGVDVNRVDWWILSLFITRLSFNKLDDEWELCKLQIGFGCSLIEEEEE
jgi:hypothetical protein